MEHSPVKKAETEDCLVLSLTLEELINRLPWVFFSSYGHKITESEFADLLNMKKKSIGEDAFFIASACTFVTNKLKELRNHTIAYQKLTTLIEKTSHIDFGIMKTTKLYTLEGRRLTWRTENIANVIRTLMVDFDPIQYHETEISVIWGKSVATNFNPISTTDIIVTFVELFELILVSESDEAMFFCCKLLGFFASMYNSEFVNDVGFQYFKVAQDIVFPGQLKCYSPHCVLETCSILLGIHDKFK